MIAELISEEDLKAISEVCSKCMWRPLIDCLINSNNQPQELEELDKLLKQTVPAALKFTYPSNIAVTSLNSYLNSASSKFRIKKTIRGNTYKGTIQIASHTKSKVRGK